jgi:hypothetical protein
LKKTGEIGMANQQTDKRTPPYLAFATFMSGLETLQQGLPDKLDRSAWPSQSGSNQAMLLRTLRFLDLTDEHDNVQPLLHDLVEQPERRKELIRELLLTHYPKLVDLGRANGTQNQLSEAMGEYGIDGDARRKAITFFLQAADYAEIPVSNHWPGIKKRGASGTRRRASGTRRSTGVRRQSPPPTGRGVSGEQGGDSKTVTLRSGGTVTLNVSVSVMSLTPEDRAWVFELIDKLTQYEVEA